MRKEFNKTDAQTSVLNWLRFAKPGYSIEYYRGHLAQDREELEWFADRPPESHPVEPLNTRSGMFYDMAREGYCILVQRRLEKAEGYAYMAYRTSKEAP